MKLAQVQSLFEIVRIRRRKSPAKILIRKFSFKNPSKKIKLFRIMIPLIKEFIPLIGLRQSKDKTKVLSKKNKSELFPTKKFITLKNVKEKM